MSKVHTTTQPQSRERVMSDKIKLLHKATTALWLELPESVARDFTDIQQAAIEELQARVEALEGVREAANAVILYGDGSVTETNFQKLEKALAATEQEGK